jgi:PilZ domain
MRNEGTRERRRSKREIVPLAGTIRLPNGREAGSVVLNLSESGAKLALPKRTFLTREFDLFIPARQVCWRVRVAWQRDNELGVCRV